ncbi:helix-hairpin-helix domain-containing protein [Enterococcus devriesei]|uniref:helix-hairpin-helix domain-containing protein n=1 Tax=Enterococcus devriesei TaxID=319970 RepID=UPI0028A6C0CD|nr:helix-hairpin-helix domain-containing protein [Enterococcus devriesei]
MKHYLKKYPYLLGLPVIIIGLFMGFFLLRTPAEETTDPELFSTSESTFQETTNTTEQEWYVDVKGAVKKAGMYRITQGMRLMDVIDLAGGFTPEADQNQVNFSKLLTDQEIIYVPKVGETIPAIDEVSQGKSNTTTGSGTAEKININTADLTELQQLTGIGEKKAADIIKYREENGSFRAVEDLTKVSGIGEKTLENLKDSITI